MLLRGRKTPRYVKGGASGVQVATKCSVAVQLSAGAANCSATLFDTATATFDATATAKIRLSALAHTTSGDLTTDLIFDIGCYATCVGVGAALTVATVNLAGEASQLS